MDHEGWSLASDGSDVRQDFHILRPSVCFCLGKVEHFENEEMYLVLEGKSAVPDIQCWEVIFN